MISNTSHTLVGEGWPIADITKPAQNRNNYAVVPGQYQHPRAGSGRTAQERSGSVDTLGTQETKFLFARRSPLRGVIAAASGRMGRR